MINNIKNATGSVIEHLPFCSSFVKKAAGVAYTFVATFVNPPNLSKDKDRNNRVNGSPSSIDPIAAGFLTPVVDPLTGGIIAGTAVAIGSVAAAKLIQSTINWQRQGDNSRKNHFKAKLGPQATSLAEEILKIAKEKGTITLNSGLSLQLFNHANQYVWDFEGMALEEMNHIHDIFKHTSPEEIIISFKEFFNFIDHFLEAKDYLEGQKFDNPNEDTLKLERTAWMEAFADHWHEIVPENPKDDAFALVDYYEKKLLPRYEKLILGPDLHNPFAQLISSSSKMGVGTAKHFLHDEINKDLKMLEYQNFAFKAIFEALNNAVAIVDKELKNQFEKPEKPLPENHILVDFIGGRRIVRACSEKALSFGIYQGMEAFEAKTIFNSKTKNEDFAVLIYRNKEHEKDFKGYPTIEVLVSKLFASAPEIALRTLRKKIRAVPHIGKLLMFALDFAFILSWPARKIMARSLSHMPSKEQLGKEFATNLLLILRFPGLKVLFARQFEATLTCFEYAQKISKDSTNQEKAVDKQNLETTAPEPTNNSKYLLARSFQTITKIASSFFPHFGKLWESKMVRIGIKTPFWMLRKVCKLTFAFWDSHLGRLIINTFHIAILNIPKLPKMSGLQESFNRNEDYIDRGFSLLKRSIRIANHPNKEAAKKVHEILCSIYEEAAELGLADPDFIHFKNMKTEWGILFEEAILLAAKIIGDNIDSKRVQKKIQFVKSKNQFLSIKKKITKLEKPKAQILKLLENPTAENQESIKRNFDTHFVPVMQGINVQIGFLNNLIKDATDSLKEMKDYADKLKKTKVDDPKSLLDLISFQLKQYKKEQMNSDCLLKNDILNKQVVQLEKLEKNLSRVAIKKAPFTYTNKKEFAKKALSKVSEVTHQFTEDMVEPFNSSEILLEAKDWAKDLKWQYEKGQQQLQRQIDYDTLLLENLKTFMLPRDIDFSEELEVDDLARFKDFMLNFDLQELQENYVAATVQRQKIEHDILYPEADLLADQKKLEEAKKKLEKVKEENLLYINSLRINPKFSKGYKAYLDNQELSVLGTLKEFTRVVPDEIERIDLNNFVSYLKNCQPQVIQSGLMEESHLKWEIAKLSTRITRSRTEVSFIRKFDASWWLGLPGDKVFDHLLLHALNYAKTHQPWGLFKEDKSILIGVPPPSATKFKRKSVPTPLQS